MRLTKWIVAGFAVAGLTFATTGCGIFSPDDDTAIPYYKKDGKDPNAIVTPPAGNDNGGQANLSGGGFTPGDPASSGGTQGMAAPGKYTPGSGVSNNYDGFGTPIPGVTFQCVYFKFDQSIIDPAEAVKVDAVVKYLQSNPRAGVVIEGNCDSKGTEEYNRSLGERRALAAQEMMLGAGIDPARIKTLSYGEEKPAVQGDTPEAHAQNRRDNFVAVELAR